MKRLFYEIFTKFSQDKIFYKKVKISIKVLTKLVCQTKHHNIYNFINFLIVLLRVKNSDSRYNSSNIKKRL